MAALKWAVSHAVRDSSLVSNGFAPMGALFLRLETASGILVSIGSSSVLMVIVPERSDSARFFGIPLDPPVLLHFGHDLEAAIHYFILRCSGCILGRPRLALFWPCRVGAIVAFDWRLASLRSPVNVEIIVLAASCFIRKLSFGNQCGDLSGLGRLLSKTLSLPRPASSMSVCLKSGSIHSSTRQSHFFLGHLSLTAIVGKMWPPFWSSPFIEVLRRFLPHHRFSSDVSLLHHCFRIPWLWWSQACIVMFGSHADKASLGAKIDVLVQLIELNFACVELPVGFIEDQFGPLYVWCYSTMSFNMAIRLALLCSYWGQMGGSVYPPII